MKNIIIKRLQEGAFDSSGHLLKVTTDTIISDISVDDFCIQEITDDIKLNNNIYSLKNSKRIFLNGNNYDVDIKYGDKVQIDSKDYSILFISDYQFPNKFPHKELIINAD